MVRKKPATPSTLHVPFSLLPQPLCVALWSLTVVGAKERGRLTCDYMFETDY